jgi:hypothetical protein
MSKFDAKEKLDNLIYRAFNIASDLYFHLNTNQQAVLKNNKKFQDRHSGGRCFILGTGPSINNLTNSHIQKLSKEFTIAVNSAYKAPKLSPIKPTYYSLLDNNYWGIASYTFSEIADQYKDAPPIFITDIRARSAVPAKAECIYLHAKNYPVNRMRFDITKNLSITMNVVSFSILCAIYMGFREIYLLGCDYDLFCSRVGTHCYDDNTEIEELPKYNLGFYLKYYQLTTQFHYLIADLAKDVGVRVINASEGSLLDAYPHKHIEQVL